MAQASKRLRHIRRIKRQRTLAWRAAEQLGQQNHAMRTFLLELQRRVKEKETAETATPPTPTEATADADADKAV